MEKEGGGKGRPPELLRSALLARAVNCFTAAGHRATVISIPGDLDDRSRFALKPFVTLASFCSAAGGNAPADAPMSTAHR